MCHENRGEHAPSDFRYLAALIEGQDLSQTIERLFDNPDIDHLHVHNEPRGCWAARVVRRA